MRHDVEAEMGAASNTQKSVMKGGACRCRCGTITTRQHSSGMLRRVRRRRRMAMTNWDGR